MACVTGFARKWPVLAESCGLLGNPVYVNWEMSNQCGDR